VSKFKLTANYIHMKLNFKHFGEGEPLVILHGLFGSLDNWQTIGKKLAENFSVYLVDLPNHGKSPHTNSFNYDEMANAVADFCRDNNLDNTTLLGHSMGGKTAMNFAVNHPELLKNLIVVDIAPKKYPPHHDEILDGLLSFNPSEIESRQEADELMSAKISNLGIRMFLLKNLTRSDKGGYAWKMNLDLLSKEVNKVIDATVIPFPINIPTLFIRGEKSNYILEQDYDKIYELFPLAKIETVENAGHWVHAENPEKLEELITEFMG
jgi:esterase